MPDVDNGQLVTRYFRFADIAPQQAWDLLEWCARHGADELTITAIVVDGDETRKTDDFFEALDQHQLPEAQRRTLANPASRVVPLWRLSAGTIRLLQSALPNGYASRINRELWLEDLNVYRNEMFMMGVVSIERGGAVRITEAELAELRIHGFTWRRSPGPRPG